ncbi:MAG: hypothetical protein ACFFC7_24015 [Candidatus Hermodarchaeota archaeon]
MTKEPVSTAEFELRREKAEYILSTGKVKFAKNEKIAFPRICLSCLSPLTSDAPEVELKPSNVLFRGEKSVNITIPDVCSSCKPLKPQTYVKLSKPQSGFCTLIFTPNMPHRDGYLTKLLEINPELWNVTPAQKIKLKRDEREISIQKDHKANMSYFNSVEYSSEPKRTQLETSPEDLDHCQDCNAKISLKKSDSEVWTFYNCEACGAYVFWKNKDPS